MSNKYTVFPGEFDCQTCGAKVKTLRLYHNSKELTWMCPDRHVSTVSLKVERKKKEDYE
jgi:hypothetical protein